MGEHAVAVRHRSHRGGELTATERSTSHIGTSVPVGRTLHSSGKD